MRHILIILISFLLLSPFLTSCEKYVGEYKDGIPNGQGTYTSSNGEKYEGEWKDEKPWNGTYYDKDGNIKGKFVNGKEIHQ